MNTKRDIDIPSERKTPRVEMFEHIVIGAGINGSSAAYQLARRGRKVLMLEKVVKRIIDFKIIFNLLVYCK